MFANVIVENKSNYIDDLFTYGTGELDVKVGSRVTVPFGNKEKDGYVFSLSDSTDIDPEKIRDIISVDPKSSLNAEMISTAVWMKARYAIRYYDAVRLFSAPLTAFLKHSNADSSIPRTRSFPFLSHLCSL